MKKNILLYGLCLSVLLLSFTGCANFLNDVKGFTDSSGNLSKSVNSSIAIDKIFNIKSTSSNYNIIIPTTIDEFYLVKGKITNGKYIDYDDTTTSVGSAKIGYVSSNDISKWSEAKYVESNSFKISSSASNYLDPKVDIGYGYILASTDYSKTSSIYKASDFIKIEVTSATRTGYYNYSWDANFSKKPDALYLTKGDSYYLSYNLTTAISSDSNYEKISDVTSTSYVSTFSSFTDLWAQYGNFYVKIASF